jgi:hypothetical protein
MWRDIGVFWRRIASARNGDIRAWLGRLRAVVPKPEVAHQRKCEEKRTGAVLLLLAAVFHETVAASIAGAAEPAQLAVFDFELIDTSLQGEVDGTDLADEARLRMIETELRRWLEESGRFELVDTAPATDEIDAAGVLWSCNGCEVGIARRLDAELALVGWVQKVSNLILNLNVVMRDTGTREQVFASSVDIRGNTDEGWRHGVGYLLENRLLKE